MAGGYETWIGRRYVRARSSNRFLSLISGISMAGIGIAVATLIVVLSVVNGFERELQDRLLSMSSHAIIESPDGRLSDWERLAGVADENARVIASAPYVEGQGLLLLGEQLSGTLIRGVDPLAEAEVSGIASLFLDGSLDALAPGEFGIVIGVEMAEALNAELGSRITLTLAEGVVTPAGVLPRSRRFTVVGIYRVGMFEFDRRLAFVHINDAQRLFRLRDDVTGIRLATNDVYFAPEIVREVGLALNEPVLISDWTRRHVNFFRSIQITKSILFVILLLVIAVAAFNIVSTLVMVVRDKQGDIAILRTAGARPASILRIFITQGSIIGVVGTLGGLLVGVLVTLNLEAIVGAVEAAFGIKLLAADVYFISDLPAELQLGDVLVICSIALALSLLATLYPAWRGSRTLPAEALRYD